LPWLVNKANLRCTPCALKQRLLSIYLLRCEPPWQPIPTKCNFINIKTIQLNTISASDILLTQIYAGGG
ncbi:MAG TPA: hypothetical protein PKM30_08230, partial [Saprospiraceae bacterium]|nr:hypothetical protein [Saprospiraceae bacterium]HNH41810.1 hypothetical protein [Saprospiraceae bacterium]HNI93354.1 hypothetical protein [Saprospiraceae bacterium]HNK72059.1 hypothetical protein [Saprospiraceae bacterium]HNU18222.1 hypothetical protein [Saprospiraceae bacterium]